MRIPPKKGGRLPFTLHVQRTIRLISVDDTQLWDGGYASQMVLFYRCSAAMTEPKHRRNLRSLIDVVHIESSTLEITLRGAVSFGMSALGFVGCLEPLAVSSWHICGICLYTMHGIATYPKPTPWRDGALPPPRFQPLCVAWGAHRSSTTTPSTVRRRELWASTRVTRLACHTPALYDRAPLLTDAACSDAPSGRLRMLGYGVA
jgi:hypothetical protein